MYTRAYMYVGVYSQQTEEQKRQETGSQEPLQPAGFLLNPLNFCINRTKIFENLL